MINSELTKWQEKKERDYGGLVLYFSGLILVILGFTLRYYYYYFITEEYVVNTVQATDQCSAL